MSPPWMPLYVADYLADTTHMSAAEHGAYLLLIMNYWQKGGLPKDEALLARICRMSSREWGKSRGVLSALFEDGWTHHRIDSELEKARVKSEARAECGSRGGKAKALKDNDARLAIATDLPDENVAKAIASSSQPQSKDKSLDKVKQVSPLSETASPPRTKPAEDFLIFWKAYPTTPIMSRKEALAAWGKLSPEDRQAAARAVEPYRAYCRANPTYSAVHACRFLSQRRFDGFGTASADPGAETPREKAIRQLAEMKARDAENERLNHGSELFGDAGSALQEPARRSCDDPPEGVSASAGRAGNIGNGGGKVVRLSDQQAFSRGVVMLESHDPGDIESRGYGALR